MGRLGIDLAQSSSVRRRLGLQFSANRRLCAMVPRTYSCVSMATPLVWNFGMPMNWKAPICPVGDVVRIMVATILAATFTISVSAQEGSGTMAYSTISFPRLGLARGSALSTPYGPTSEHGTLPGLRCELAGVGYREISLDRLTGNDAYLAIFAPPSIASRTRPENMVKGAIADFPSSV